jgi:tetratricopeptide (TPR) repeat protein
MKMYNKQIERLSLLVSGAALAATTTFAQGPPQQNPGQQPQSPVQQQPGQQPNPNPAAPLTLESSSPPVNAEEEEAIKNFRNTNPQDADKKDHLAEQFIQKYPQSRYLPEVYNWLVRSYYRKGEVDKMEAAADKQLAIFPDDPQTLAIVGTTLPRAMNASTPDPEERLAKAEKYCQKALELLPTIKKPDTISDETFQQLKNETSAMAYSGLGLVAFRRAKYDEAIPDLENAIKANPQQPDPVNYYVLGIADEKASRFDDAVAAFTKCAAIPSGIKDTCTQNIQEAKKRASTQLSMPK